MSGPIAAWYEDPSSPHHQRWWYGERWTEHTRLAPPQPVLAAPPAASAAVPAAVPAPPAPPSPEDARPAAAPHLGNGVWSAQPTAPAGTSGGTRSDGETLAIASLVCGVLWLFWLGSIAAIVTGIMALRRKVIGGHQVMAIIGIVLGGLSFLGAPVIAAVAIPVFVDQRDSADAAAVQSEVRNAAVKMEMAFTTDGRYPSGDRTPMEAAIPGSTSGPDVDVTILSSDASGYCLEAAHRSGAIAWYDSRAGGITDVPCA
jgi:hypothetical protein